MLIIHKMLPKILLIIFVSFVSGSYGQRSKRFFRKDYTYMEAVDGFYKIHLIPRTWAEAKLVCAQEGAIFWHPDNNYEAQKIIAFWKRTNPKIEFMYVGLSDIVVEGIFKTVEGKPLSQVYSTWETHEPNNAGGEEDCVHIDREGYMNDCLCDNRYSFICKKSLQTLEWNYECNMPNFGTELDVDDDVWFDNYKPEGRGQCGSMFYTGLLINTDCEMKSFFICEHEIENIASNVGALRSALPLVQPYVGGGVE